MRSFSVRLMLALCALLAASCDSPSGPEGPGIPAQLDVIGGNDQEGTVGAELPQPLVVRVTDSKGKPVEGQIVNFRVVSGGGSVFGGTAQTDAQGEARERWILGTSTADSQRVEARVVDPTTGQGIVFGTFRATAKPGVPAAIAPVGPAARSGTTGAALADSLAAQVRDQYGNPVPQAAVVWTVRSGGGTISPATSTTNAEGIARALWTLGTRVDSVQVAEAAAGVALRTEFTATAAVTMGAALVLRSGGGQTGTVGTALPQPVRVALLLPSGIPVVGATVTWSPTAGTVSPQTSVTDGNGEAQTTWTLGTTAGAQGLTATTPGASPVTVSATATPGPALRLVKVSGDGQSGVVNTALPNPLVVMTEDVYGNPVAGVPVAFAVTSGGGSVTPVTGTTDAAGRFATTWTLGGTAGTQAARASSGTLPPVSFTATAGSDPPPQLSVTAPVLNSVARPALRVDADCTDNAPAGCTSVKAYVVWEGQPTQVASGTTGVHTTISLTGFEGREVFIEIVGTDSRGQTVSVSRRVYVESSPRWTEEATAGALLLDLDAQRLLFFDVDGSVRIASRTGGGETILRAADPAAFQAADSRMRGWLHSQGAVFTTADSDATQAIFDWRAGTLVSLGNGSPVSLKVAGDWAMWTGKSGRTSIYRRDLAAGTTVELASNVGNIDQSVAANGDVAFWNGSYDIVRYRNGALTPLTSDDNAVRWNVLPETDGINVVFRTQTPCCASQVYAIEMITADGSRVALTSATSREVFPGRDYAANGGWVAYTMAAGGGPAQVWTRAPDGTVRQATQAVVGAASIRALGANGELAFSVNEGLYVALPPYTSAAVYVGAAGNPTRLEWRGSELFAFLGRSAFRVSY